MTPPTMGWGLTTTDLTYKSTQATTLELRIVAISSTSSKITNDLGATTNSRMTPSGDQEVMTKATVKTMSYRMASEPPQCQQCRHGRRSSTTPPHTAT
jgi:hypothetical protein